MQLLLNWKGLFCSCLNRYPKSEEERKKESNSNRTDKFGKVHIQRSHLDRNFRQPIILDDTDSSHRNDLFYIYFYYYKIKYDRTVLK